MNPIYEPREDSELIGKCISEYAKGKKVLDMGTGSGYLADIAARYAIEVIAADINPKAIEYARLHHPLPNVTYILSDLFKNIQGKFDLILFNSPYLPSEEGIVDLALDGGPEGWEVIAEFLRQAREHLARDGIILLLFSSLTKQEKVDQLIDDNNMKAKCVAKSRLFFEDLFVYEIKQKN